MELGPGYLIVDRFGPCTFLTLHGGGTDDNEPYGEPAGSAGVYWAPWMVLARMRHARSKEPSLCVAPFGTPDDMRSIGRVLVRAPGIIVFTHPQGPVMAYIEDRLVQNAGLDSVEYAKWITDSGHGDWAEL
jgi:hypothetical protein